MIKPEENSHPVIPYITWLRYGSIQEYCFLFSLSFLITNLVFTVPVSQSILSFLYARIQPLFPIFSPFIQLKAYFPALTLFQPLILDFLRASVYLLIIFLIFWRFSLITYKVKLNYSFYLKRRIAFILILFFAFLYTAPQISPYLFIAPLFFWGSMHLWKYINNLQFRHILLFFSILLHIIGIWLEMLALHSFPLRTKLYPLWDSTLNLMQVNWSKSGSLISIGLSLLTGCLLIISWSPSTPCPQWNPFSAGTLMQSRRTATLAVSFSVMMCFSSLDNHYRLGFIIFLMQLALNITIAIFCHTLQDDANTRRYVSDHILLDNRFIFSESTEIYRKVSCISQHVALGIEKYNRYNQLSHFEALLNTMVLRIKRLIPDYQHRQKLMLLWGITIGYASLPFAHKASEDLYKYAIDLHSFIVRRKEDDITIPILYDGILLGLLLSMMKLCDESNKWSRILSSHKKVVSGLFQEKSSICDADKVFCQKILLGTMSKNSNLRLNALGMKFNASSSKECSKNIPDDKELQAIFSCAYCSNGAIRQDNDGYK